MKLLNVATSIAFGTSVIIATSLQASEREPLDWQDLDHFQIDCSLKKEQTEYLNSMRTKNVTWLDFSGNLCRGNRSPTERDMKKIKSRQQERTIG